MRRNPLTAAEAKVYALAKMANARFDAELKRVYKARAKRMRAKPQDWTDERLIGAARVYQRTSDQAMQQLLHSRVINPLPRRGPNPRGRTPAHLKKYLFKKGHR